MKIFIFLTVLLQFSCVSMSSFQTGRTMRKGEIGAHLGLGAQSIKYKTYSDDSATKKTEEAIEKLAMPVMEGGIRYGVANDFDVNAKYALLPGSLSAGAKYMLHGHNSPEAFAAGLLIDYTSFSVGLDSNDSSKIRLIDFSAPFYTSYDFTDSFSPYFTPRIGIRTLTGISSGNSYSASAPFYGINVGFIFGYFGFDYAMQDSLSTSSNTFLQQFTIGLVFGSDELEGRKRDRTEQTVKKEKKSKKSVQ